MPQIVRTYIFHVAIGFALSTVFTGVLLYTNTANLWHLVTHTAGGALGVFLLWMFSGTVFAGVQFGIHIMSMAENNEGPKGGRKDTIPSNMQQELIPIPVRK